MKKLLGMLLVILFVTSCTLDLNPQDGKDGTNGNNGATGEAGQDGSDGANGLDGIDGINGTNGTNGSDGEDGIDGVDGIVGLYVEVINVKSDTIIEIIYSDGTVQELDLSVEDSNVDYDNYVGEWKAHKGYSTGSIVKYNGSYWQARWCTYMIPREGQLSWRKL